MHDGSTAKAGPRAGDENRAPDPAVVAKLGLGKQPSAARRVIQVVLGLALLAGLGGAGQRYWANRGERMRQTDALQQDAPGNIDLVVSATGTVKGLSTVEVGAEVSGKITKVN